MPENLNIKIDTKYQGKGLDDLKREFKSNQEALDNLIKSGKKGTAEFKNLQAEQKKLGETIKGTTRELKGLDAEIKKSNTSLTGIANTISGSLKTGLIGFGSYIGSQLISSVAQFGMEAAKLGAELSVLRDNFAGSAQDLELFKKATAGTVTEANLIKLSNQASDLGVSLKDQALLFALAEDAGDKYGGSLEENFYRVVMATDGSAKGLKAVGLGVTEFKKELEKIEKTLGVHLDQLSAEEQIQYKLQAIYALTGISLKSVEEKTVDVNDAMEILSSLGDRVKSAFGAGFIKGLQETEGQFVDISKQVDELSKAFETLGQNTYKFLSGLRDAGLTMRDFFKQLQPAWLGGSSQGISEEFPFPFVRNFKKAGEVNNPNKEFATPARELNANFNLINEAIINSTDSLSQFFSVLAGGEQEGGFKAFMKSIVNTFITSIQAMIFAAGGAASAKGITTFGLSLITDLPALAAAWAALELAKGTISGLAEGGVAQAGRPYIVGEREPEVFVPRTSGTVLNSKQLLNLANMGLQSQNVSNVYIGTDWDFVKFNKVMNSSFKNTMKYKLLN